MGLVNLKKDNRYIMQRLNSFMPQNNMFDFSNFTMPVMPNISMTSMPNIFTPNLNFTMPSSSPNSIMQLYSTLFNKNTSGNYGFNYSNNFSSVRMTGNMGKDIVSTAKQYLGFKESDGSFKVFTGGSNQAWCADFVTHVVKEAYRENGKKIPSGFGSSSVEGLRQWGKNNNCYLNTSDASNKSALIAQNVKPGDVVIFKNGTSHTGIVTKVNADGSFQTIEGNTSNKVAYRNYSANNSKISGFVQLA